MNDTQPATPFESRLPLRASPTVHGLATLFVVTFAVLQQLTLVEVGLVLFAVNVGLHLATWPWFTEVRVGDVVSIRRNRFGIDTTVWSVPFEEIGDVVVSNQLELRCRDCRRLRVNRGRPTDWNLIASAIRSRLTLSEAQRGPGQSLS